MHPITACLVGAIATALAAPTRAHAPVATPTSVRGVPDVAPDANRGRPRPLARHYDFDLGDHADVALRQIEVKKGDTFLSLARERFGNAEFAEQIAALNPKAESDKLVAGAKLWMPLRTPPPRGRVAMAAYALSRSTPDGTSRIWPLPATGFGWDAKSGTTLGVVLVPAHELAALGDATKLPADWQARGFLVATTEHPASELVMVPSSSPATYQGFTLRLEQTDKQLGLKATFHAYFDKDHKVLDEKTALGKKGRPKEGGVFLLLGGLLGGGLLARRRRGG